MARSGGMGRWLAGILATVISGVLVAVLVSWILDGNGPPDPGSGGNGAVPSEAPDEPPQGPEQLPDLVVRDITPSAVVVANDGDAPAGPFDVEIRGERVPVDGLAPGEERALPDNFCEGLVDVHVDPDDRIGEADEGNNRAEVPIIC